MAKFSHIIVAIDTHAAGEPTRIVLSGLPPIHGETMAAKKRYMRAHLDHFRTLLMQEPRGHSDMFGAILTPPTTACGQYGLLFMDSTGYLDMCGHGTMSVTTALIEMGMLSPTEPETIMTFDTPAGTITSHARVEEQQVVAVSVANVPSFLYASDVVVQLPGVGAVAIDVAFGGNFFALVPARAFGLTVQPAQRSHLIHAGMLVKQAVNATLRIQHPTTPHITTVELTEIYEQPDPARPYTRSVVIFGDGQMDRSPCGTGTSAAMATRYGKGALPLGVEFINESIIGTRFRGHLVRQVQVGELVAVQPVVTGTASITGLQQFVVDPDDPVKYGFTVGPAETQPGPGGAPEA
jgi:proline racemase/trans-L-3-hydroxyproline dehydratase